MGNEADQGAMTPISVEAALRRVRVLTAVLIAARLATSHMIPVWEIVTIVVGFLCVNVISLFSHNESARVRTTLAILQLLADAMVVLFVTFLQRGNADAADWAVLVLPVIEGAIQFQMLGAILSWSVVATGYGAWTLLYNHELSVAIAGQRLAIVLLVALPSGFLADNLVAEIAAHRRGRYEAEHRGSLLRAAALGGRKSTSLDVDEILDVLRGTVADMGFAEPQVFELVGDAPVGLRAHPVRQSRDVLAIAPGDERLLAADRARSTGAPVMWPPDPNGVEGLRRRRDPERSGLPPMSKLFATPVTLGDNGSIVLTARWPGPELPPASQTESLELFAAQAGASLRNAQVFLELQALKDRLAHEASHDALTDLPNRRRFHDQLERMCRHGRPEDTLGVLFLDLDGFKDVNDRYGHDIGNDLLVAVAVRLRRCVRPGDIVARMGGDEFAIMLTRIDNPAPAIEVADRICVVLQERFTLDAGEIHISTSIGIALAPADTADPGDLVRRADVAMYRAKSQGKAAWAMDPGSLGEGGSPEDSADVEVSDLDCTDLDSTDLDSIGLDSTGAGAPASPGSVEKP